MLEAGDSRFTVELCRFADFHLSLKACRQSQAQGEIYRTFSCFPAGTRTKIVRI